MWEQPSSVKFCTYIILHSEAQTFICRNKKKTFLSGGGLSYCKPSFIKPYNLHLTPYESQPIPKIIIQSHITFVGSYYSLDFHLPTYVIISCKCNSYYICGKLCVTFVVGSCYYVCGKFIIFAGLLYSKLQICITFVVYYVCGLLLRLRVQQGLQIMRWTYVKVCPESKNLETILILCLQYFLPTYKTSWRQPVADFFI